MKKQPRTEIVSVRLTPAEKELLKSRGGITKVVRRALEPHPERPSTGTVKWPITAAAGRVSMVWQDGTVGQNWPANNNGVY